MATNVECSAGSFVCRCVATAYALAAPGAATNMLSATTNADGTTGLTPSALANAYRITVSLATTSVFNVYVTDGTTAYTQSLNDGTALTAGRLYTFTFGVSRTKQDGTTTLTYQFRVATDGIIQTLLVDEVSGAVV